MGSVGNGMQVTGIAILLLYSIQSIFNFNKNNLSRIELFEYEEGKMYTLFSLLNDINILSWFPSTTIISDRTPDEKYLILNVLFIIVFFLWSIRSFTKQELVKNLGLQFRLPFRKSKDKQLDGENGKAARPISRSVLVFYANPLRNYLPYAADQIYSDRRAMLILMIAVITIWPLQLYLYVGDVGGEAAKLGFSGAEGVFALFGYGYDFGEMAPWTWWVVTQAIGNLWIIMIPMAFAWIRGVVSRDGDKLTGDLIGPLPATKRTVVFQRLLGVYVQMIWIGLWLSFWYVTAVELIKSQVGRVVVPADPDTGTPAEIFAFNNSIETSWMLIAIFCFIFLYAFIVSAGIMLNLMFENRGKMANRIFILGLVIWFVITYASGSESLQEIPIGIAWYNPVEIIIDQQISWGIPMLIGLSVITHILINRFVERFSWLKIEPSKKTDE